MIFGISLKKIRVKLKTGLVSNRSTKYRSEHYQLALLNSLNQTCLSIKKLLRNIKN